MSYFTGTIIVNKPVDLCFDFVAAPGYWASYHPSTFYVKQEEGSEIDLYSPPPLGAKWIEVATVGFFHMDIHWHTIDFKRPNLFTYDGYAIGGAKMQISYEFSEVCAGVTSWKRTFQYTYKPFIMKLLNLFYLRSVAHEDGVVALPKGKKIMEAMPCDVSRYQTSPA